MSIYKYVLSSGTPSLENRFIRFDAISPLRTDNEAKQQKCIVYSPKIFGLDTALNSRAFKKTTTFPTVRWNVQSMSIMGHVVILHFPNWPTKCLHHNQCVIVVPLGYEDSKNKNKLENKP